MIFINRTFPRHGPAPAAPPSLETLLHPWHLIVATADAYYVTPAGTTPHEASKLFTSYSIVSTLLDQFADLCKKACSIIVDLLVG